MKLESLNYYFCSTEQLILAVEIRFSMREEGEIADKARVYTGSSISSNSTSRSDKLTSIMEEWN